MSINTKKPLDPRVKCELCGRKMGPRKKDSVRFHSEVPYCVVIRYKYKCTRCRFAYCVDQDVRWIPPEQE